MLCMFAMLEQLPVGLILPLSSRRMGNQLLAVQERSAIPLWYDWIGTLVGYISVHTAISPPGTFFLAADTGLAYDQIYWTVFIYQEVDYSQD